MKFTYNWLKQYVDFDWSPQELAEKLTFAGIEVEDIVTLGGKIPEQVVIAQILSSDKHPNADKLSVCRVNDGTGERQIVCGAKNYKVGDKVPLALPGAAMGAGFTIKESKLRGILSQGMMCSAEELGLPKAEDGLLILPADAPLGKKFSEYVGPGDTVYDIEVTPNRPDWLSVIGIAREIAALTGNPLKLPADSGTGVSPGSSNKQTGETPFPLVEVEAPDLCPRYTARMIRGVKIGPSPAWLKSILEKVGLRSINNVVDITNYVLLESGHPLHAFDFNLLKGNRIIVRRAKDGEEFGAIVGSQHKLTGEMLVIADAERAVALAGIMGGQNSEINDATTDVLLESAWFLPANVRKTSKQLSLTSDSSYRFERGADIGGVIWASNRAALLIQQLAGGTIGGFVDVLAKPVEKRRVKCRYAQVNRLLGVEVPPATVKKIFTGLGLEVLEGRAPSRPSGALGHDGAWPSIEVEIPTYRVDLEREADLIEEVCRIYGVENIPAKMLPALPAVSAFDAQWDERRRVRATLNALGFHEALNQTMVSEGAVKLQNPLNAEMTALRQSLVPGLLQNLRTNVSRHQYDMRLFEIGRVFAADGKESLKLALAATGRRTTGDWERTEKSDYFDLKGALEQLGVNAEITEIPEKKAKKLDLRDAVYVAECELPARAVSEKQFVELPKFPAIVRDVALVVDEAVTHRQVLDAIERGKNLEAVALFDVFRGGSIPAGKKSVAYSLTFRAADRTLTDTEVNAAHEAIKKQLQAKLACEIRVS
ncbi:MAG: Phenylalanine--tRNA ligase beta subunit [Verrucomicrobiae bacterium]|nr:Phenylalanine--tRNA ligase beta subunit [Verrucomicrobiae bacterium]